jgi:hypothetical protein
VKARRRLAEPAQNQSASDHTSDHAERTGAGLSTSVPAADVLAAPAPVPAAAGNAAIGRLLRSAQGRASAPDGFADRLPSGGGQSIPEQPRQDLESGLGVSLSSVRLHTDTVSASLASDISADAFTVGQDVYFGKGRYDPGGSGGYWLLAHEVTHTLQQDSGPSPASAMTVSDPADRAERDADVVADALVARRGGVSGMSSMSSTSSGGDAGGGGGGGVGGGGSGGGGAASAPIAVPAGSGCSCLARHASWEHTMLGDTPPSQLGSAAGPDVTLQSRRHLLTELNRRMVFFVNDPGADPRQEFPDIRWIQFRGSGLWASNGEVNALADYLPDPSVADSMARDELVPVLQKMRNGIAAAADRHGAGAQGVAGAVNSVLDKIGLSYPGPGMESMAGSWMEFIGFESTDAAGEVKALDTATAQLGVNRYQGLLSRNACHFAPFSWHRWEQFHNEAVEEATAHFTSRGDAVPLHVSVDVAEHARQALLKNGYGDHFLEDSFAAGHLVDKTLVMQWWLDYLNTQTITIPGTDWEIVRRGAPDDDVLRRMASAAQPGVAARDLYRPPSADAATNEHQRLDGHGVTDPQTAQERSGYDNRVEGTGVTGATPEERDANYRVYLEFLNNAQAQAAAGWVHDELNKVGLVVANGAGQQFKTGGDDTLLSESEPAGAQAAATAASLSRQRIEDHLDHGQSAIKVEDIFQLVPVAVVPAGGTAVPLEQWQDEHLHQMCVQTFFPDYYDSIKSAVIGAFSAKLVEQGISPDSGGAPRLPVGDFPVPSGGSRAG